MTPQAKRVAGLAGVIAVLGAWLLLDLAAPQKPAASAARRGGGGGVAANGSALLPGAPPELLEKHDVAALATRYAPVLASRPFAVRSFRPPPREAPRPRRDDEPRRRDEPRAPDDLELLLTGTIGTGPTRTAYLEHRASGRALVVRSGDKVGSSTVAEVETTALILVEGEKRRRLELGELFALPPAQERGLTPLRTGPPPVERGAPGAPGSQPAVPPPSEEQKNDMLKKMRERRQASLQKKPPEPPPEAPPPGGDSPSPDGPPGAPVSQPQGDQ